MEQASKKNQNLFEMVLVLIVTGVILLCTQGNSPSGQFWWGVLLGMSGVLAGVFVVKASSTYVAKRR